MRTETQDTRTFHPNLFLSSAVNVILDCYKKETDHAQTFFFPLLFLSSNVVELDLINAIRYVFPEKKSVMILEKRRERERFVA